MMMVQQYFAAKKIYTRYVDNSFTGYFLLNDGSGSFTTVPMANILGETFLARGATFGDIDNDGFVDLITYYPPLGKVALFINNTDGTFTRVQDSNQFFANSSAFSGLSMADYDNDGFLDLFVPQRQTLRGNALYRNMGEWRFQDVTAASGLGDTGYGLGVTVGLRKSEWVPALVIQMVGAGEESGTLDDMLIKVADYYDQEVDRAIKTLSLLIEPILIVCIGVLVLFLALSIFMPMWDMAKMARRG